MLTARISAQSLRYTARVYDAPWHPPRANLLRNMLRGPEAEAILLQHSRFEPASVPFQASATAKQYCAVGAIVGASHGGL